jgi:lysophospholipase L1-like esterase
VFALQARGKAGLRSRFQPDEGLSMIANLGRCLARMARGVSQATLALCLAGGSTLALADDSRGTMLSLGDSVVFGFITQDGPAYVNADNFIGYPEIVGNALRLDAANPSCPGETTAGFLSFTGADNGCRPFRARFPLHESYSSTQLDFALAYLGANRRKTRLVTLSLGANDGFLLIAACNNNPACIQANLPAVLGGVFANLNTILSNLRATGFHGVLMVVNYYSTDYSDAAGTALILALNQTLAAAAAANGVVVADAFTAFQQAAAVAGGKTCFAGLLNANPANQGACDVHPSITGQRLLAKTVQAAYRVVRHSDD